MKSCVGVVLLCVTFLAAQPAEEQQRQRLQEQASACANAFLKGDYAKFVDHVHPSVVTRVGGRDKMLALIKGELEKMKDKGLAVQSFKVGSAGAIVRAEGDLMAIVPTNMALTFPGKIARTKSFFIAVSSDKGETWKFVDGGGTRNGAITKLLPHFPAALKLPELAKPVIEDAP